MNWVKPIMFHLTKSAVFTNIGSLISIGLEVSK